MRVFLSSMEIVGQVERITFESPDHQFVVLKLRDTQTKELIVVVGPLYGIPVGETVRITGNWDTHPKYGLRFKAEGFTIETPSLPEEIERYLSSGILKGVGPATAKKIVQKFGEKSLEVLEERPEELLKVKGISPNKLKGILSSWEEHRDIKGLLIFLKKFDLPTGLAFKLQKHYKDMALSVLKEDPYRLALEVSGIGFLKADAIAKKLGHPKDSPSRFQAGLIYVLSNKAEAGHSYYPREILLEEVSQLLEADRNALEKALLDLCEKGTLVEREFGEKQKGIYLRYLYTSEAYVGKRLSLILQMDQKSPFYLPMVRPTQLSGTDLEKGISLNDEQLQAVKEAFQNRFLIITGGPGTGKTTVIRTIVGILKANNQKVVLAAPTGRAAKRISELTGEEAKTIHRLLGWSPETGTFLHNEKNPLRCHVVIVDEASMVDIVLFSHLLRALPETARLILVGDKDQLPPVGPGSPFMELIGDPRLKSVRLTKVYRQDQEGLLILNAHRINQGLFPILKERNTKDFLFIHEEDPQRAYAWILDLATKKIPQEFNLDPMEDIQILSPMRKGVLGVQNLTSGIQEAFVGSSLLGEDFLGFRIGDKVMQLRNDYGKDVYNGDIGRVVSFQKEEGVLVASFYGREVPYDMGDIDDLTLAYCISVHKSQGSEYPAVILTLSTHHYPMLQRNLLYTAITRAKRLAVIVGTKKAMAMAIKNDKPFQRYSGLISWL